MDTLKIDPLLLVSVIRFGRHGERSEVCDVDESGLRKGKVKVSTTELESPRK